MNLVIDIGNTRVKAAIFNGDELVDLFTTDSTNPTLLLPFIEKHQPNKCIISSVSKDKTNYVQFLQTYADVLLFQSNYKLPIDNLYQSINSLGTDRLAAIVGASSHLADTNVLVINAGTCITYDFLNKNKQYLGGAISTGLEMRFKALNTFTEQLPLIAYQPDFMDLIGNTTENSIRSGVQIGMVTEIEGIINRYNEAYSPLSVIITGGDTNFLVSSLKNSIFAPQILYDPQLVLKGLNKILTLHHA